jgi:hypothetical protein
MNRFNITTIVLIFFILASGCADTTVEEKTQTTPKLPEIEEVEIKDYELFLGENIAGELKTKIDSAQKSIRIGMYKFCSTNCRILKPILDSLIEAKNRGVDVQVYLQLVDKADNSPANYLIKNGISTYQYQRPDYQYHRFMVIDSETVFFGSQKFTCIELGGRGYGLGLIADNTKLAAKIELFLNHQTITAKLIGPELEKWPLATVNDRQLLKRQQKMTDSIRKTLQNLIKAPDLESCWEYLTPELKNSILDMLITELRRGDTEAQSTAKLIEQIKKQENTKKEIKIKQVTKLLKSFHPDILQQLQSIISRLQQKTRENMDEMILHDNNEVAVIEPAWFLGPQLAFQRQKEGWLVTDLHWTPLGAKGGIKTSATPGVLSLYYETNKKEILDELKTLAPPSSGRHQRISTTVDPVRLSISGWDERRLQLRMIVPTLKSLPLPAGSGREKNVKITIDGWKDNSGQFHQQTIFSGDDALRRSSSHSQNYSLFLSSLSINPPENLQGLRGNLTIKFPLQLYKTGIDKKSFSKNKEYDWGKIDRWEEEEVQIQLHPNNKKDLYYISSKNEAGEYIYTYPRVGGNVITIHTHRDEIGEIELFFSNKYFRWEKDFELPLSVYENTYKIEELKEGVTTGGSDIKLNKVSTDDKERLKLEFTFSGGIRKILQWQPYSITGEKIRPRSTRHDYSNNQITHHLEEFPKTYKIRLGAQ